MTAAAAASEDVSGKRGIEPQGVARETGRGSARDPRGDAHEIAGSACASTGSDAPLERADELQVGGGSCLGFTWRDRVGNADTPRQLLLTG